MSVEKNLGLPEKIMPRKTKKKKRGMGSSSITNRDSLDSHPRAEKVESQIMPGDLVRVRSPEGSPIQQEMIGLFVKRDELMIGKEGDSGASYLITDEVFAEGQFIRLNHPHWRMEKIGEN